MSDLEYVPLMVEAGYAFPGRLIAYAIQSGEHLAVTFTDGTSACTCGAQWFHHTLAPEIRRRSLELHVERWL